MSLSNLQKLLNEKIEQWNLLRNPFYQAWSMGTLTKAALQTYATNYGDFLNLLPLGWETLNDSETAAEETEHAEMWAEFTASLQADVVPAQLPATQKLVARARQLFSEPATATGALYAFEAQQPATASSKLAGLQTHYSAFHADEQYFEVHSHNEHEAAKLLQMMEKLSPTEQESAVAACSEMSQLIWDTLSAVYQA